MHAGNAIGNNLKIEVDKNLACVICNSSFLTISDLKEHVRNPCKNTTGRKRPYKLVAPEYNYPYTPGQPVFPSSSVTRNVFNNTQKPVDAVISPDVAIAIIQNNETNDAVNDVFLQPSRGCWTVDDQRQTDKRNFLNLLQCLKQAAAEDVKSGLTKEFFTQTETPLQQEVIIDNYAAENTIRNGNLNFSDIRQESPPFMIKEETSSYDQSDKSSASDDKVSKMASRVELYADVELVQGSTQLNANCILAEIKIIHKEPFVVAVNDPRAANGVDLQTTYLDEESGKVRCRLDGKEVIVADSLLMLINDGSDSDKEQFLYELGAMTMDWCLSNEEGEETHCYSDNPLISPFSVNDEVQLNADMKSLGQPLDILATLATSAVERSRIENARRDMKGASRPSSKSSDKYMVICNAIMASFVSKIDGVSKFERERLSDENIAPMDQLIQRLNRRVYELDGYFRFKSDASRSYCLLALSRLVLCIVMYDVADVRALFDVTLDVLPRLDKNQKTIPRNESSNAGRSEINEASHFGGDTIAETRGEVPTEPGCVGKSGVPTAFQIESAQTNTIADQPAIKVANINLADRTITVPGARLGLRRDSKGDVGDCSSRDNNFQTHAAVVAEKNADRGIIEMLVARQQAAYAGSSDNLSISCHSVPTQHIRGATGDAGQSWHGVVAQPQDDVQPEQREAIDIAQWLPDTTTQYITEDGQVLDIQVGYDAIDNETGETLERRDIQDFSAVNGNVEIVEVHEPNLYPAAGGTNHVRYITENGEQVVLVTCDSTDAVTDDGIQYYFTN